MGVFGDSTDETTLSLEEQNDALEKNRQSLTDIAEASEKVRNQAKGGLNDLRRELELAEARGDSEEKLFKLKQEIQAKELFNKRVLFETFKGDSDKQIEIAEEGKDIRNKILADELAFERSQREKNAEARKRSQEKIKAAEIKFLQDEKEATFEILRLNAEERIRAAEAEVSDQGQFSGNRLKALQVLNNEKQLLLVAQRDKDLEGIKEGSQQELAIITKFGNDSNALLDEYVARRSEIKKEAREKDKQDLIEEQQQELDILLKSKEVKQAALQTENSTAAIALNERLSQGQISQKEYNEERARLDKGYHIKALQAEVEYTKALLEVLKLRGVDVSKEQASLAALELQISDLTRDQVLENEAKKKQAAIDSIDKISQAYQVLSDTVSGALNASAAAQKNKIQEEIDAIEKRKEAELKANEARVQSDQDRAANAIVIETRAQSEREKLERRQREIDQQKARADKALAVFSITLSTAKNIAAAITPFGKILAAISGAAQLAIAIATPIPKFIKGKRKGQAYEGPGIVNDGPNMEVIERADGSIEFPSGKNVLTHVGRNDIIHPDKDQWLHAFVGAANRDANAGMRVTPSRANNEVTQALNKQTRLLQQIATKKELHLGAGDKGMVALWKWGASQTKYIQENTNW